MVGWLLVVLKGKNKSSLELTFHMIGNLRPSILDIDVRLMLSYGMPWEHPVVSNVETASAMLANTTCYQCSECTTTTAHSVIPEDRDAK